MQPKPTPNDQNEEIEPQVDEAYTPDFVFLPKGRHTYRQEGPYLVCRSCELHHAVFIGIENIMMGEDEDGNPIVKSKKEVFGD